MLESELFFSAHGAFLVDDKTFDSGCLLFAEFRHDLKV
uniref:Uncharacterized protein n=1 Tax=Dulem virus 40 TaxID=3145758 RepID=A0AAU8AUN7_9CAUD